ncbi:MULTISPECIES: tRNA (guanosine(46)-N7)-methyltransferase TrmB [Pontibacillus]|uniref:tRNA (guanine-N(7)-)-methyltransferase n=1 Tax=Pontibacillus chungwhensis TaxID=265426 RepID=A0ABY8UUU4_9BACI|nr:MULTISPECIES: tRNA (guanosine(46)-N7)-methyltransferase TrmB [Pontibacillus]MCD5323910.1 tRNA (guanosine(46)-N7)-methyltransferase TrmB [Pontibacillus sp. HN14]WIF97267.1 tRNA (guanosine(46)-N7)-methyltransferase TrmB [Pontibacillus chungwhensis]
MRLRNKPWADDFMRENNHVVVEEPFSKKDKWNDEFKEDQPLHLEIGSGKGAFISGMGKQHPEVNFIGIERVKSVIVGALRKVLDADVSNVRLLNVDASDLRDLFGDNEVDQIYLNFSDPWPKSRHEKRRLTFHTFLEQYEAVLKPNGQIVMKTDNQHLFEYSLMSFSQYGCKIEEVNLDLHGLEDPYNVMTEYEEKFSNKGQPIYRCRVRFPDRLTD